MADDPIDTPAHIDDAVQAILQLHDDHHASASATERLSSRVTTVMATSSFLVGITAVVVIWIGWNLAEPKLGWRAFDPPPFDLLQGVATLLAVYATILILTAQRREDDIAGQRERLSLQLAMLNARKIAKLIELMEELRRDHPELPDRVDSEAADMARPTDSQVILGSLRDD